MTMMFSHWTLICFNLYLQPWDKPSLTYFPKDVNDQAYLSHVIFSAYSCFLPVGGLSVLFVCLFMCFTFSCSKIKGKV